MCEIAPRRCVGDQRWAHREKRERLIAWIVCVTADALREREMPERDRAIGLERVRAIVHNRRRNGSSVCCGVVVVSRE